MTGESWMTARTAPDVAARTGFACPQCGAPVEMPEHADAALCAYCDSTLVLRKERGRTPVGEAARAVLHSVQCPQCAGSLGTREGRRILVCDHCGVRVAVRARDGFSRWYFPVRLDGFKAVRIAQAWLQRQPGISRRARDARFVEAQLFWAPIWEYKALVAGWEFGSKLRTRCQLVGEEENARLDLQLVRVGVEEPQLQERRLFQAATDLGALGATRPRITGREPVLPLLAGELEPSSIVLKINGDAAEMVKKGRKAVLQPLSGASSPDAHLFTLKESTSVLFYPLWLLRYRDGNRDYRMVVNGRNGNVNSATAPAAVTRQMVSLGGRVALMAAAITVLAWLAAAWGQGRAPLLAAAAATAAVAILMVSRFRVQREVEYHEPFSS